MSMPPAPSALHQASRVRELRGQSWVGGGGALDYRIDAGDYFRWQAEVDCADVLGDLPEARRSYLRLALGVSGVRER
jgi:hypothetical protein